MKICILVTARMGSTRLTRKHLLPVLEKPILQFLIDAIAREFATEIANATVVLAIATSDRSENDEFRDAITGCDVFMGSDENIPLRHLQAANYYKADAIISVDGDDILCSPLAMRTVFRVLSDGAGYVKTEGLPLGMNASGYSTKNLKIAMERFGGEAKLETGWGRVFDGIEATNKKFDCDFPKSLRFTLDYEEDYRFFMILIQKLWVNGKMPEVRGIVDYVMENKLDEITKPIVDIYWKNFYNNIDNEDNRRKS